MTINDDYPVKVQHIELGIANLKRRQRNLRILTLCMSTVGVVSLLSLLVQHDIVYSLFGLTSNVEQLHLPYRVDENLQDYLNQSDYLLNLLSWFGWLLLKSVTAFVGAFIIVSILKKFRYFLVKFQSFILKFIAWLLAFIFIWGSVTYLQSEFSNDQNEKYQSLTQYDENIQQSDLYQYLNKSENAEAIKSYLLVQTALLHRPIDKDVATAYASQLIQAERKDPHFFEYGFKPEQIWSIQHQLYGKSVSPVAQSIEPQVLKAKRWENVIQMMVITLIIISFTLSLIMYFISTRLKGRLVRISDQLK